MTDINFRLDLYNKEKCNAATLSELPNTLAGNARAILAEFDSLDDRNFSSDDFIQKRENARLTAKFLYNLSDNLKSLPKNDERIFSAQYIHTAMIKTITEFAQISKKSRQDIQPAVQRGIGESIKTLAAYDDVSEEAHRKKMYTDVNPAIAMYFDEYKRQMSENKGVGDKVKEYLKEKFPPTPNWVTHSR